MLLEGDLVHICHMLLEAQNLIYILKSWNTLLCNMKDIIISQSDDYDGNNPTEQIVSNAMCGIWNKSSEKWQEVEWYLNK